MIAALSYIGGVSLESKSFKVDLPVDRIGLQSLHDFKSECINSHCLILSTD